MSRQEQELDAAEYVIGTLSGVERRVFDDLMSTDKQTQEDVWYWERAFGALNASISPDAPPAEMWERIEGSLPSKDAPRRLPNLLKSKILKDKKKAQSKRPNTQPPEEEPIVSDVPVVAEEEAAEEVEAKKSRIWLSNTPEPTPELAAEPIPVPAEVGVVEEIKVPEPVEDVVEPEYEKAPPIDEKDTPGERVKKPVLLVDTPTEKLSRKLRRWRLIALLAILCLLALIWWIFSQRDTAEVVEKAQVGTEQKAKQYLAVVNANGDQPSLVIQIDSANGAMKIEPIGILIPAGKSLQLWYQPKGGKRIAVGLLSDEMKDFRIAGVEQGGVLEITVEPAGGALTDQPNGPVVYSGALKEIEAN